MRRLEDRMKGSGADGELRNEDGNIFKQGMLWISW